MPWELLFAAIGTSSFTAIILTVVFTTLAQKWIEQATEGHGKGCASGGKELAGPSVKRIDAGR
jgi:hypothetical protein